MSARRRWCLLRVWEAMFCRGLGDSFIPGDSVSLGLWRHCPLRIWDTVFSHGLRVSVSSGSEKFSRV